MAVQTRPHPTVCILQQALVFLIVLIVLTAIFGIWYVGSKWALVWIGYAAVLILAALAIAKKLGNDLHTTYDITADYVMISRSFIGDARTDVPASQITNISYQQGIFFDRWFNTGTLSIFTSGGQSADIVFSAVPDITAIYQQADQLLDVSGEQESKKQTERSSKKSQTKQGVEHLYTLRPDAKLAVIFRTLGLVPVLFFIFLFSPQVFIGLFLSLGRSVGGFLFAMLFFIVAAGALIGWMTLTYANFKRIYYAFYTTKLEYYDGFLVLRKATVPLERITDVSEQRGMLERLAGVSRISIQTAGSQGSELQIHFVRNADEVVAYLKEVLKKYGRN